MTLSTKYTDIIFDIETIAKPIPDALLKEWEAELREEYVQEKTIQTHLAKRCDKFKFDGCGARPVAIAMLNSETKEEWVSQNENTESLVADFVTQLLMCGDYRLVGFNCSSFDLVILSGYIGQMPIASLELHKGRVLDLIEQPLGYFIGKKKLKWYAEMLGIQGAKQVDGSDVHQMWVNDIETGGKSVSEYCMSDVRLTYEVYQRLGRMWKL